jgi:hypothetical protein
LYIAKASYDRSKRQDALRKNCLQDKILHVLIESELGQHEASAELIARLMDSCACPNRVQVHVLEHVSSIKAHDLLTPALARSSLSQSRYATYFSEQVHILKVHQSRALIGPRAYQHLLSTLEHLAPDDIIVLMPHQPLTLVADWDVTVRMDFSGKDNAIVTYPMLTPTAEDWTSYFTSLPEPAAFFVLNENLDLVARPMARPAMVPAFGISLRHPFAGQRANMELFLSNLVAHNLTEDLAISALAKALQIDVVHSSKLLAKCANQRRFANRRTNLSALHKLVASSPELSEDGENAAVQHSLYEMALEFQDDDVLVYGRAYLGISASSTKQEILIKWGSEEAFETEKEALKYG